MIRKATTDDIDSIAAIYEHIHDKEEQKVQVGWIRGVYPVRATAAAAVAREEMFVYEEKGRVVASAVLNRQQVDVYALCEWRYPAEDHEVMVMHTLCVDPAAAKRGIGKAFVSFYERYALYEGCRVLRIDTNEKNTVARRLYQSLGYREAAVIPCAFNGIPDVGLVLLEKRL